ALVENGLSIYHIDADRLARLEPDLIVTQDHCAVCAVTTRDVEQAVCTLARRDVRVCSLHPGTLADLAADFSRVAAAAGVPEPGGEPERRFAARLARVHDRLAAHVSGRRPKVLCIEWMDPLLIAGGWMPELVGIAGGEPVPETSGLAFARASAADLE